jgi:hypothetical protein
LFLIVEQLALDLASGLEGLDHVLVLPANLVGDTAQLTVLEQIQPIKTLPFLNKRPHCCTYSSSWLEFKSAEARWNNHLLLLVIWSWHAFQALELLESLLSSLCLVWNHASDGPPEDLSGRSEMDGTTVWVDGASLAQKLQILD